MRLPIVLATIKHWRKGRLNILEFSAEAVRWVGRSVRHGVETGPAWISARIARRGFDRYRTQESFRIVLPLKSWVERNMESFLSASTRVFLGLPLPQFFHR